MKSSGTIEYVVYEQIRIVVDSLWTGSGNRSLRPPLHVVIARLSIQIVEIARLFINGNGVLSERLKPNFDYIVK